MGFIATWLVSAIAVGAAISLTPGITILSLGLFALVINALMLELASFLSRNITHAGIVIDGFGAAFFGAIVVSIVTMIVGGIVR